MSGHNSGTPGAGRMVWEAGIWMIHIVEEIKIAVAK
jgi:hypothetical protein